MFNTVSSLPQINMTTTVVEPTNVFEAKTPVTITSPVNEVEQVVEETEVVNSKLLNDTEVESILSQFIEPIASSEKRGYNWHILMKKSCINFCNFISENEFNGLFLSRNQMVQVLIEKVSQDTQGNGKFDKIKANETFEKVGINFRNRKRNVKSTKVETVLEFED